jgi:DUF4097 and DUF4098 domain-containing protein YvlB
MTSTLFRRAGAPVLLAAATATVLAGCGGVGARLTFNDTEKVKVSEIVMTGGSGNVTVKTAAINETRISRVIHHNADPGETYRMNGTVLHIDTDCGSDCSVSYEIEAPTGVAVRGELSSGDVDLTGIGSADVHVSSGNIEIKDATGPVKARATSGDIDVIRPKGATTAQSTSGDVRAVEAAGPVTAKATSGEVEVNMTVAQSVTAEATSGNVDVVVPAGTYQVKTDTGSGDTETRGIVNDPTAKIILDLRAGSGDVTLAAA